MDRHTDKACCLADDLPHLDKISDLDDRRTGRTNVHPHRNGHLGGSGHAHRGA